MLAALARLERRRRVDAPAHQVLLDELHEAGEIDWSRAVADSSHVRAKGGAS